MRSRQRCSGCSGTRRACGSSSCCGTGSGRVGRAPGRARARLGRDVSASCGAAPDRPRRVAAGRDERLLPRRRRARLRPARSGSRHHRATALRAAVDAARARRRRDRRASRRRPGRRRARRSAHGSTRRRSGPGSPCRRAGAAAVCVAGFLVLATGSTLGAGVHERVHAAFRRRRAERALPGRARPGCSGSARLLARLSRG